MTLAVVILLGSLIQEGTLHGVVSDPHGASIPGARMLIEGKPLKREITTDEKGEFEVRLPAGTYRVEVRSQGFKPSVKKRVRIGDGRMASLRIHLSVVKTKLKCPSNAVCL